MDFILENIVFGKLERWGKANALLGQVGDLWLHMVWGLEGRPGNHISNA
jgi:hypothetical protein